MKRISLFLLISIITGIAAFAQQRSMDEVMRIAQEHMERHTTNTGRRVAPPTESATTLRASDILPTPLRMNRGEAFYVLSYPKSNRFVMVSGDERMSPVLAYSDEHAFDPDNMAPQTKEFIQSYAAQAEALQNGAPRKLYSRRAPEAVTPQKIEPLLKTTWSQRTPYNNRCPLIKSQRALTGCLATAISQLMNYYQYPKVGIGSISYTTKTENLSVYVDLSTIYFAWDKMLDKYISGEYNDGQATAISNLMFAVGASVNMDYGLSGSSSYIENAPSALIKHFKYDKDICLMQFDLMSTPMVHQFIMQELIAGRPIPCSGKSVEGNGHAFIIDGMTPDGDDYPFYHFNWGWGGLDDGEYKIVDIEYCTQKRILLNVQPENDVVDIANFVQARIAEPSAHKVNPTQTGNINVRVKDLYNGKQETFNGMINVYIVNEEGTRTKIGEKGIQLVYDGFYNYDISCKVPEEMPLGTYMIEAAVQDLSTEVEDTVYFAEESPLVVTDEAVDYVPNMQATQMEFVKGKDTNDSTVCVALTNFMNFNGEPFKGDVSLALASESGKLICMLGTPVKSPITFERHKIYSSSQMNDLKGVVPDSVPDGIYHVVVMVRQEGFEGWGLVKKYDLVNKTITNKNQDLFLTIQIENGKIKTDNIVVPEKFFADIETLEMTLNKEKCKGHFFSVNINNYFNHGKEKFAGRLSLALADDDNNIIVAFGKVINATSLETYHYIQGTFTLEGEMPDTLSDGHYRLCAAAQQEGYSNWTPITQYAVEGNKIAVSNVECFIDLWVINGRPTLDLVTREDVNRDGVVDTQDVLAIYLYMQNATGTEEFPVEDVNNDGIVDTQDVLAIYNYMQEN